MHVVQASTALLVHTPTCYKNPVLKKDHNHCPEPVKLEVGRCQTDMIIRAAASNDLPACIYVLQKCLLPKCPITKTFYYQNVQLPKHPVTKTSITKVSFTEMSGYRKNCGAGWLQAKLLRAEL